ncbi:adhesion regulating molecule [Fimicolochytrium jonesii]|uniref:adhesion regulating molecule n=1 Tax=Fimicolochytrium jonesii TaxID=1396493 RepID=UPI0022FDE0FF|nr:adhesion regulating molecule [Fimicolochytrium jonesii]KAI8826564.1 adhesion regulating molecule [Fimicolochytrium jonesii]
MATRSAGGNIFGAAPAAQHGAEGLVSFRAGKCTREGTRVTPEARKGLLYMNQGDDGLMHLYWKDRRTGAIEDDLIIFPEEADFLKVTQSEGRVYVLKFKSSSQRLFFWLQEPKADRDEELARKVNSIINNPPSAGGFESDFLSVLQQSQREQTPLSPDGSTTAQLEQIRRVLANISVSDREAEPADEVLGVITPEMVQPILSNTEISRALFPNLPPKDNRTTAEIQTIMNGADFRESARSLSAALRTGQLNSLIGQLGPNSNTEALQTFLQAVQDRLNQTGGSDSMETD